MTMTSELTTAHSGSVQAREVTLWVLGVVIWLGALLAERFMYNDSVACQLPGSESVFGDPGWSWMPLGHTCTWRDIGGLTVVDSPPMMTLLPPLLLVLWGLGLLLCRRGCHSEAAHGRVQGQAQRSRC